MSSRALRRRLGDVDILSAIPGGILESEEHVPEPPTNKKNKKKKKSFNFSEFVEENNDDCIESDPVDVVDEDEKISDKEVNDPVNVNARENVTPVKNSAKKKKKRKKKKDLRGADSKNENGDDEIEASIREVNRILGLENQPNDDADSALVTTCDMKSLLQVEHRNLNPENELKRIFGSRVVQQEATRQRGRNRTYQRSTKLIQHRDNWAPLGRTGLSMTLVEKMNTTQMFAYEHSVQYQQVELKFFEAVESLNPQNIANLLQVHPYHIHTLIQLSDVFKMSEDMQMAAELIERAILAFEHSFHSSFSLTTGTCRLDYRRQENRAFYLCLFRHLSSIGQRGCYKTALEYCKLLLSLDPDGDPVCVLLMIDFYAIRAEQYAFLTRIYHEWEARRNLTQLPNFAFSVPLAMFHTASSSTSSLDSADAMLQSALIMFPGLLLPLLDKCSVSPDASVTSHSFFGPETLKSQSESLKQLLMLYIGRSFSCWKEPEVVTWLERNVKVVMDRVDKKDPAVEDARQKRSVRYQGTPRNIYRHIIMAEIKDATAALPPELTTSPILSYDPLPPHDAIVSYERTIRGRQGPPDTNSLSLFLRSLLPNYNPNDPVPEVVEGAAGGEGNNLRQGIGALMDAMRDLLTNIQPVPPPVENQDNGEVEEHDGEWD